MSSTQTCMDGGASVTHGVGASPPARNRKTRLTVLAIMVLLSGSGVLNVLLASRLHRLARLTTPELLANHQLQVGTAVPPIPAMRLDGHMQTITYADSDRPTVLYIFTPQCVWCFRNLDNLKTLVAAKGREERFIGISLSSEGLRQYVSAHNFPIPVYTLTSPETLKVYSLRSTPQTIVVSPEGRVIKNWIGAYGEHQKSNIEAFFHVTLPGIPPASTKPTSPS